MTAETGLPVPRPISDSPSGTEPWRAPAWLANWSLDSKPPVSLIEINRAIVAVERALAPAPEVAILAGLETLLLVWNPPISSPKYPEMRARLDAWWDSAKGPYVAALADLPLDLLGEAARSMMRTRPGAAFMPRPADLRAPIADALASRSQALARLRLARSKLLRIDPPAKKLTPVTPEQRARIDAYLASLKARSRPELP